MVAILNGILKFLNSGGVVIAALITCAYSVYTCNRTNQTSYQVRYFQTVFDSKREAVYDLIKAESDFKYYEQIEYREIEIACNKLFLFPSFLLLSILYLGIFPKSMKVEIIMDSYKLRIRPLIEACEKSDMEIERDLNLPRSTIYDWNNGRSKSYKKYLPEIAAYFGVSTDYLLGNTDIKNAPADLEDSELLQNPDAREALIWFRDHSPEERKRALNILKALDIHPDTPKDK